MAIFKVSALVSSALETMDIKADTIEDAIDQYRILWETGAVKEEDCEFDDFTVTDPDGKDHIIRG